jgi:hypothetical protein
MSQTDGKVARAVRRIRNSGAIVPPLGRGRGKLRARGCDLHGANNSGASVDICCARDMSNKEKLSGAVADIHVSGNPKNRERGRG